MTDFKGTKQRWTFNRNGVISTKNPVKTIGVVNSSLLSLTEDHANALLISKAPELLRMLERIYHGNHCLYPEIHKEIKTLIKEATEL